MTELEEGLRSTTRARTQEEYCDPPTRVTKSLLGYGVIAGPVYVVVWLVQAATRSGFNISRDAASLLSNGPLGWIQVTNFLVTGAMVIAAAVGFRRALSGEGRTRWAGWLVGLLGVGMLAAGLFKPDASYGFPPGTQAGKPVTTTTHGNLHLVFGSLGFLGLIVATMIFASWLRRRDQRGLANLSAFSGIFFLVSDLLGAVLATHHEVAYNLTLTIGILVGFSWLTWTSMYLYRMMSRHSKTAHETEVVS
jgi:hypothetical protein